MALERERRTPPIELPPELHGALFKFDSHPSVSKRFSFPGLVEKLQGEPLSQASSLLHLRAETSRDYRDIKGYPLYELTFGQMKKISLIGNTTTEDIRHSMEIELLLSENQKKLAQALGISKYLLTFISATEQHFLNGEETNKKINKVGPGFLRYRQSPLEGYLFRTYKTKDKNICNVIPNYLFISNKMQISLRHTYVFTFEYPNVVK